MDVDLTRLEAILSPYIVLLKDEAVEYVSDGLAKRLGVISEQLKKNLEGVPELFMAPQNMPSSIALPAADRQINRFTCTPIPMDSFRVIAFAEEAPANKPVIEYADRDTFVRMFNRAPMGCLVVDEGMIVYTNDYFCSLMGLKYEQVLGTKIIGLISQESRAEFIRAAQQWHAFESEKGDICEIMFTRADCTRLHFLAKGGWLTRGSRQFIWIILNDRTENKRLCASLKAEQRNYSELFSKAPAGIVYISPRGRIMECNDHLAELVGYPKDKIKGKPFTEFVTESQADILRDDFNRLFTKGMDIRKRECVIHKADGEEVHIEYSAQVIYRKGHRVKALMMLNDVTDKKALEMELLEKNAEMERTLWDMAEVKDALEARAGELNKATEDLKLLNEKLNLLSITDGLTDVFNHRHFQDRLTEEVERVNRLNDGVLSLLIMDIDDFKRFNDTYGHQCGDMVLRQIAGLIKGSIRSIDILARYGGEEFAVILPNSSTDQALIAAERICETVRSTPFSYGSATNAKVTVSIGVGTITSSQADKAELVRKADSAMYAAKAKWKNRVEVWEED